MITHVVTFRWKSDMPSGQVTEIAAALDTLPLTIGAIRTYRHGCDLGVSAPTNFDYAVVATFDDREGWRQYDQHPVHEAIRADVIKPWIAERSAVQFET